MANPQSEPSMEEILASIRRIISEDEDDPPPVAAAPAPAPARRSAPVAPTQAAPTQAAPTQAGQAPVSQVSDTQAAPAMATPKSPAVSPARQAQRPAESAYGAGEEQQFKTEDVEMIKKSVSVAVHEDVEELIVDDHAADAASTAFRSLSQSLRVTAHDGPGLTLEDIVIELLRPMIKDWLDAHLPAIVEEKVEEEVQRIARRRR